MLKNINGARHAFSSRGSVLILVLWILVLISFLASEYVAHNRRKAATVMYSIDRFKRENAAWSVLALFASAKYDFLKARAELAGAAAAGDTGTGSINSDSGTTGAGGIAAGSIAAGGIAAGSTASAKSGGTLIPWMRLLAGGIEVFVKIEKESSKIRLSLAGENNIRTTLKAIYGEDREQDADAFSDALLDWIDPDDLLRLNGAEKAWYQGQYPACDPGNGPFKSMSQIFLVKGFEPVMFWGDAVWEVSVPGGASAIGEVKKAVEKEAKEEEEVVKKVSILESFTIYPKEYMRISMLFPQEHGKYYSNIFFVVKKGPNIKIVEQLSRVFRNGA